MSLCDPAPVPAFAEVPVASDFRQRFVRDAHELVAEGYARLVPAKLATKNEEAISGELIERITEWFNDVAAPEWTRSYFVVPELPVRSEKRQGKKRPRIDIYVESSYTRPRARFAFEAKRFYRSDSVAEYLGAEGLGAFLDGTYMPDAPVAGMLGFVQTGTNDDCIRKVHDKLHNERDFHGLARDGAVWASVLFDERIGTSWVSNHRRLASRPGVAIYHSFLRCCT